MLFCVLFLSYNVVLGIYHRHIPPMRFPSSSLGPNLPGNGERWTADLPSPTNGPDIGLRQKVTPESSWFDIPADEWHPTFPPPNPMSNQFPAPTNFPELGWGHFPRPPFASETGFPVHTNFPKHHHRFPRSLAFSWNMPNPTNEPEH